MMEPTTTTRAVSATRLVMEATPTPTVIPTRAKALLFRLLLLILPLSLLFYAFTWYSPDSFAPACPPPILEQGAVTPHLCTIINYIHLSNDHFDLLEAIGQEYFEWVGHLRDTFAQVFQETYGKQFHVKELHLTAFSESEVTEMGTRLGKVHTEEGMMWTVQGANETEYVALVVVTPQQKKYEGGEVTILEPCNTDNFMGFGKRKPLESVKGVCGTLIGGKLVEGTQILIKPVTNGDLVVLVVSLESLSTIKEEM